MIDGSSAGDVLHQLWKNERESASVRFRLCVKYTINEDGQSFLYRVAVFPEQRKHPLHWDCLHLEGTFLHYFTAVTAAQFLLTQN